MLLAKKEPRKKYNPINTIVIEGRIVDGIHGGFQNIGSSGKNEYGFNLKSSVNLFNVRFRERADYFDKKKIKNKSWVIVKGNLRDFQGDVYIEAHSVAISHRRREYEGRPNRRKAGSQV